MSKKKYGEWRDKTSYSKYDNASKPRKEPDTWVYNWRALKITLVHGHIKHPGEWIANCRALGWDCEYISMKSEMSAEQAKTRCIEKARNQVMKLWASLPPEGVANLKTKQHERST